MLLAIAAPAETRPHYGGTLRVAMRGDLRSLDPAAAQGDAFAQIAPLIYDTLTHQDANGKPLPALASAWQQESEHRWRLTLRSGARFSDGTPLGPSVVAQSLHDANADWNVRALGDAVLVESEQPLPDLPAQLALARNSIALRADDKLIGSGPFRVSEFQPGRRITLAALEESWHGRPFMDAIEIQFGRTTRDQAMDLELGRVDVIEVAPEQLTRMAQSGRRVVVSDPVELLALRFSHSLKDARVRQAIARSVDRDAIVNVLLQRHGEAAGSLLPNWISGYAFLFPTAPPTAVVRQVRTSMKPSPALTLVYDATDPLARLVAERIALNAADAGITLKTLPNTQNTTVPDAQLLRLRLPSTDAGVALSELARGERLSLSIGGVPVIAAEVYRTDSAALQEFWAVPIAYMPVAWALNSRVRNWTTSRDGSWRLEEVWLAEAGRP
ncbi:MAG: ABC transporter substrate-binding protein [Terriglobales bacterium]